MSYRGVPRPRSSLLGCGNLSWPCSGAQFGLHPGKSQAQLIVRDTTGPVVKCLTLASLGLVARHDPQKGLRHLVDGTGVLDPVNEGGVRTQRTTQTDVHGLDQVIADVGGIA